MPTLHGISHERCAMHATKLFFTCQVSPYSCRVDRKSTFFKLIVNFFLKSVVFMFWHDIVYIELLYCVTNFEHVWT